MSEELKACPFCGGQPFDYLNGTVTCDNCIKDNYDGFPEIYKGVWNTRPLEDALRSRVEGLERELKRQYEYNKSAHTYNEHNLELLKVKDDALKEAYIEIARLREIVAVVERLGEVRNE